MAHTLPILLDGKNQWKNQKFTVKVLTIKLQSTLLHGFLLSRYFFVPNFVFTIVNLSEFLKKKEKNK